MVAYLGPMCACGACPQGSLDVSLYALNFGAVWEGPHNREQESWNELILTHV